MINDEAFMCWMFDQLEREEAENATYANMRSTYYGAKENGMNYDSTEENETF